MMIIAIINQNHRKVAATPGHPGRGCSEDEMNIKQLHDEFIECIAILEVIGEVIGKVVVTAGDVRINERYKRMIEKMQESNN